MIEGLATHDGANSKWPLILNFGKTIQLRIVEQ
jgi:hypothetical protein